MHQRYRSSGAFIEESPIPINLGVHLRLLRDRQGLDQIEIVKHLSGWQQAAYSRIENGTRAPMFESLPQIWSALLAAGVRPTLQDRETFLSLAQEKLESRKTRHARRSADEWSALRIQLAEIDGLPLTKGEVSLARRAPQKHSGQTPRREIGHLLGRERWLSEVIEMITRPSPVKVLVLQGPPGSGKTSELHRLARHISHQLPRCLVVLSEPAPIQLERLDATDILEQVLGDVVAVVGSAYAALPTTSLEARIKYVLECLAKADHPVMIHLDNAEHLFDKQGNLGTVWRRFLTQFLQTSHQAILVMASQEWPTGTFLEESQLMVTIPIPRFSREEGSQLLQTLGMRNVPEEVLGRVVDAVGGMPVCLEWIVRLAREPLLRDEWADFEDGSNEQVILERLLQDAALFGGPVARRVQPLLDRVLGRLSMEAATALQDLAVAPIALGAPALRGLYQSPKHLRELREASLLVAYPQRIQLLPMVAAQVRHGLSDDQVRAAEERLMMALSHWLNKGIPDRHEQGVVFTELACLLLRRHHFLAAAELVLYHGWLSSQVGQMLRLARLVQQLLGERVQEHFIGSETDVEAECGGLLLHSYLASYLGEQINEHERAEAYKRILERVSAGQVKVEPLMQVYLVDHIMRDFMTASQFDEAQSLFDTYFLQLEPLFEEDTELHATLLSKQAALWNRWSGFARSNGFVDEALRLQNRAINIYERCLALLDGALQKAEQGTLWQSTLKKKQATFLNNLAYHLNLVGRYEEARKTVNACIDLKAEGYAERDSLAASLGEKSQILAALGHFREALHFDELACEEIGRCAEAGDTLTQEEQWIYQVNRGRLYVLLGRVDEAERLLEDAKEKIQQRRRTFRDMAHEALLEIQHGREQSVSYSFQLDWRWVKRYRALSAYDAYWWWAHAGPFTREEQECWDQLFTPPVDEETKGQLKKLLLASRNRELEAALAEKREPRLQYPAIEIDLVRQRIADLLALDAEIKKNEPNVIVRRLYQGAIEDETCFLGLIEATYESKRERFWQLTQQLYPLPTEEEWQYLLDRMKQILLQGLQREDTVHISRQAIQVLHDGAGITLDLSVDMKVTRGVNKGISRSSGKPPIISAQATKRFFDALLAESGFEGWKTVLDPNASGARVESGLQEVFLPDRPHSLVDIREHALHEILGHVGRSSAGEHSLLGLLGMGTKNYMPTEEGLADYHERSLASLHYEPFDDSGTWLGPLAVALASGRKGMKPLTFTSLFAFFEPFLLLYRLLWRDDEDLPTAEQKARNNARTFCLRVFRGVPDLQQGGICLTKDIVYLRGHLLISQAVAKDETILDRLSVGKVALELLPDLDELGIVAPRHTSTLRKRLYDPELDTYILSFEQNDVDTSLQGQ